MEAFRTKTYIKEYQRRIEVMQAFASGKVIQIKSGDWGEWVDSCLDTSMFEPIWDWNENDYRIKPEIKLRPYTYDELKKEVLKHGNFVETINGDSVKSVFKFNSNIISIHGNYDTTQDLSYEDFSKLFWVDKHSPCGVFEE